MSEWYQAVTLDNKLVHWRRAIALVYTEIWLVDVHWISFQSQYSVVGKLHGTMTL